MRFSQLLEHGDTSAQASWVQTLSIWRDECRPYDGSVYPKEFIFALVTLLPKLSNLKELSCRMVLRVTEMAIIARYHAMSLKKLDITFTNHDPAKTLPLLGYFPVLEDLRIEIINQSWGSGAHGRPYMPNLRLLEIDIRNGSQCIMAWMKRYTFPKLVVFRLVSDLNMSPHDLDDFMAIHGPSLHTFGFEGRASSMITSVFLHASNLKTVELRPTYTALVDMAQEVQTLPVSVTTIVLTKFGHQLGFYAKFLERMVLIVGLLPPRNALHTFRIVEGDKHLENLPYSWRTEIGRADKRRKDAWKTFTEGAARLLALRISVIDEEGVVLTDVLREEGVCLDVSSYDTVPLTDSST